MPVALSVVLPFCLPICLSVGNSIICMSVYVLSKQLISMNNCITLKCLMNGFSQSTSGIYKHECLHGYIHFLFRTIS